MLFYPKHNTIMKSMAHLAVTAGSIYYGCAILHHVLTYPTKKMDGLLDGFWATTPTRS
jgi:hypothetical protein